MKAFLSLFRRATLHPEADLVLSLTAAALLAASLLHWLLME